MTILVCGASGLVGTELCSVLSSKNINYIGTYYTKQKTDKNMININFLNVSEIENTMLYYNIKICVFLIVQRLTDVCEKKWDNVKITNIDMVNNTAFVCSKLNIKFIHLSTDYVFDGKYQPNLPNGHLNPLQNYGISKLISELKVQVHKGNYCIIRTPVLYGDKCKIHENAVTLIAKNVMDLRVKSKEEDNYCIRRPLHVHDLSLFILYAIENDYRGIYHFYNPYNKFTKYEMCLKIANILDVSFTNIIPNNTNNIECEIANRPYDTMLQDNKYNIYDFQFTDFDISLQSYFNKYKNRKINSDCFVLIDFDGTIVNSNNAHYNSYISAFKEIGQSFIDFTEWNQLVSNNNIQDYLNSNYDECTVSNIKTRKKYFMQMQDITYTNNSNLFLQYLIENEINFAVVTNTNKETVEIIKSKLPLLNNIKNWVTREDYDNAKPSKDSYKFAMSKYYLNEPYIVGIEDTHAGYTALKTITDLIYIYDKNSKMFFEIDCYIFNDYLALIY